ncbi:hypothetical protein BD408DRAFT_440768 [Parasitella parasitica]|nr:hypothetical protein BD408DRAFT_440768 [Parasitella parasitica]
MLLFFSLSNIVDCVKTALLLTDKSPGAILLSIICLQPRVFATCAFSCYLFGIAHTVCSTYKFGEQRFKMSKRIDIIFTIFLILPFVTTNICAIGLNISINQNNSEDAWIFFDIEYLQWLVYWPILVIWILLAGFRLIKILKKHLHHQISHGNSESIQKSRLAIFKVCMTMTIGSCSIIIFVLAQCLYTFMEDYFSNNLEGTVICFGIIIYHSTLASTLIIITMVFNPKAFHPLDATSPSADELPESHDNTDATESKCARPTDESTLAVSPIETSEKIPLIV